MGWNPGYSYKALIGVGKTREGENIHALVVDLELAAKTPLTARSRELAGVSDEHVGETELQRINEYFNRVEEERRIARETGEKVKISKMAPNALNGGCLIGADRISRGEIPDADGLNRMQDWSVLANRQLGMRAGITG